MKKSRLEKKVEKRLVGIEAVLRRIATNMEKSNFYDYVKFVSEDKRFIRRAFITGLSKGLGVAIGFSLLGAIAIYVLQLIARTNMPFIAEFIARIIDIIEQNK